MSALAAWDVVTVPVAPGKRRSHLRLVPPPVPARPLRRAPLRLTGAGRLVLGLVVAVLVVMVVVVVTAVLVVVVLAVQYTHIT